MRTKVVAAIKRFGRVIFLGLSITILLCLLGVAALPSSALAQESEPTLQLKSAKVELTPVNPGKMVRVRERIEFKGKPGGPIEGVMPSLPGTQVKGFKILADGKRVRPKIERDGDLKKVSFESSGGKTISYRVLYDVVAEGSRTPLLVPSYAGDGGQVVRLVYHVPDGYYLQGSTFPVVFDSTGDVGRSLQAIPTFTDYEVTSSVPSPFNFVNILGGAVILAIVALTAAVFFAEIRASSRGGEVGV